MRLLKLFFLLTLIHLRSYGQSAAAGIPGPLYTDIIPDTLLNAPIPGTEYYSIDLDQDGTNDVMMLSNAFNSAAGFSRYVSISCLRSQVSIGYDHTDSSYSSMCSYWNTANALKIYDYADTIDASRFAPVNWGFISYYGGSCGAVITNTAVVNAGDSYVGFSITDSVTSVTSYGWIRVNLTSAYECLVKDYSFSPSPVGIRSRISDKETLCLMPNPAFGYFIIHYAGALSENELPVIYDSKGIRLALPITSAGADSWKTDVKLLEAGIYAVSLKTAKGIVTQKLVVQ